MELNERVNKLEDEAKIIKNEVQAVLLDIREAYLNRENPFNPEVSSPTLHSVAATISGPSALNSGSQPAPRHNPERDVREDDSSGEDRPDADKPAPSRHSPAAPTAETKVATASEKPATEEVSAAERSEEHVEVIGMHEMRPGGHGLNRKNGKPNMATIAALTHWVGGAVAVMGRARTETVLDFAEITGHLPADLKALLVKFVGRAPENGGGNGNGNGNGHSLKPRDLVSAVVELEGLLGMNSKTDEITLLTMVCQEVDQ